MTRTELITRVKRDLTGQSDDFTSPYDYEDGVDDMQRETGWVLPQTSNFRVKWSIERTIRHMLWRLVYSSARKFKAEGFHLDQRYRHYRDLIKEMDIEWKLDSEANVHELVGANNYDMFGTSVSAGFNENIIGEDATYSDENVIESNPESEQ